MEGGTNALSQLSILETGCLEAVSVAIFRSFLKIAFYCQATCLASPFSLAPCFTAVQHCGDCSPTLWRYGLCMDSVSISVQITILTQ
jgi:hypothetical protein